MCFFSLPPVFKLIDPQPPGLNLSGFIYLFIYFLNFAAIVELLQCVSTYDSSSNKINKNKSHRWPFHVKNEDIKKEFCCAISSSHFI